MDCLARNLGLNIEALARVLAMNNDGRKPIQCLDVEDDAEMEKSDAAGDQILGDDAPNGSLLKIQKVDDNEVGVEMSQAGQDDDLDRSDSFIQHLQINSRSGVDFDKNSRQLSFKSGQSGFANVDAQNKKMAESKLTPCHPLKEISPGLLQKQHNAQARGSTFYNSALQNGANRQKKESPIIVPNVMRPSQNNMQGHNGVIKTGGTPQSVVSRASYASPYNNA